MENKKNMKKNIYRLVKELLQNFPHLREDVNYLLVHIWTAQKIDLGIETIDEFLNAISNKDLMNAESIRRIRRRVINDFPHLGPSQKVKEKNEELENDLRKNKGIL